ncbi:unnamed protein product [Effrenium voratum]|nr:unnamed protein product [Effrenium voratum]
MSNTRHPRQSPFAAIDAYLAAQGLQEPGTPGCRQSQASFQGPKGMRARRSLPQNRPVMPQASRGPNTLGGDLALEDAPTDPAEVGVQARIPLSPQQHEAVMVPLDQPLLVLAGPGSGKTHFLAARISRALAEQVPAEAVVAVTYTRKAAEELAQRVKQAGHDVWVSTVHGLALRLLREAGRGPCQAASDQDRRAAARTILPNVEIAAMLETSEAPIRAEADASHDAVGKLLAAFDHMRRDTQAWEPLATAHRAFTQELRRRRLLELPEVISSAQRLLDSDVGSTWAANFVQLLFVDEWQDTDAEQQRFLAHLARGGVTAVGDDDQRIYAWRDRGPSPPEAFQTHWPGASTKTLGANHRSLPHLVAASKRLISHNCLREQKDLWSAREPATDTVQVVAKESLRAEARWVAEEIRGRAGRESSTWGDFAILTRTNAAAEAIAKAIAQAGIPTSRRGGADIRTSQVLDLLAYLRLVVDPHHSASFLRIYNVPRRGLGKAALRCLREQFGAPSAVPGESPLHGAGALTQVRGAEPATGSFEGAMSRLLKAPWLGANARVAQGLGKLFAVLQAARRVASAEKGAVDVLRFVMAQTGLGSGHETAQAVQRLLAAAEKHTIGASRNGAACIVRLLQEMAIAGGGMSDSAVSVSTIHQAKGLEWDTVFVLQCNESVMPLTRQPDDSIEEERRLFYVAMTRARNHLVLSFTEEAEPSRFLFESGALGEKRPSVPETQARDQSSASRGSGLADLVADAEMEKVPSPGPPASGRMLRVEVRGLLHDWFDVADMGDFIRSPHFAGTLRENVARYFGVPIERQAIYDEDGLLTSCADYSRALQRMYPKLFIYDLDEMGADLRARAVEELRQLDADVEQSWRQFGANVRERNERGLSPCPTARGPEELSALNGLSHAVVAEVPREVGKPLDHPVISPRIPPSQPRILKVEAQPAQPVAQPLVLQPLRSEAPRSVSSRMIAVASQPNLVRMDNAQLRSVSPCRTPRLSADVGSISPRMPHVHGQSPFRPYEASTDAYAWGATSKLPTAPPRSVSPCVVERRLSGCRPQASPAQTVQSLPGPQGAQAWLVSPATPRLNLQLSGLPPPPGISFTLKPDLPRLKPTQVEAPLGAFHSPRMPRFSP